jgi:hypothetical protein
VVPQEAAKIRRERSERHRPREADRGQQEILLSTGSIIPSQETNGGTEHVRPFVIAPPQRRRKADEGRPAQRFGQPSKPGLETTRRHRCGVHHAIRMKGARAPRGADRSREWGQQLASEQAASLRQPEPT